MKTLDFHQQQTINGGTGGEGLSEGYNVGKAAGEWVGQKFAELIGIVFWGIDGVSPLV